MASLLVSVQPFVVNTHMGAFDNIRSAWDATKTGNPQWFQKQVPGLKNLAAIYVKNTAKIPNNDRTQVEFRGFESAVDTPSQNIPLLKRAIIAWLHKTIGKIQIGRGDSGSLVIVLPETPPISNPAQMNSPQIGEHKYETRKSPMVKIVSVKGVRV